MSYESIWSERAKKELSNTWEWYEDKLQGLGDRFIEAIFKKLKQIENDPSKGMLRRSPYREAMITVFPYFIIYRIEVKNKQIFIHSIFHTSRNPKKKYLKK